MIVANFTEFRTDLKRFLDDVECNNETLVIKRGAGSGAVMISLDEYNSMMETMHLLSSRSNAEHIYLSMEQIKSGEVVVNKLIEK